MFPIRLQFISRFVLRKKGQNGRSYISTRLFLGWSIAFLFLLRVLSAWILELSPQEAYYWNYAMHPAFSYFDHPPIVGWVIRTGTILLGNTELGVRLGGLFLSLGSTWLIYLLGGLWFGRRAGLWGALLFQLIPLYLVYGIIITPDVPLIFFWLLTLYFVSISMLNDKEWGWYLVGISLGLSLLSKYTAAFLIPSTFLFLLVDRHYRDWLWRKGPYVALLVASLIFSPVIIWNYQNNWVSFGFQFTERLGKTNGGSISGFLEFLGVQTALLFPTLFAGLLAALVISISLAVKKGGSKWKLALVFSLPMLAFFTFYSTQSLVKPNWPLPGYLSLLGAVYPCYRYLRFKSSRRLKTIGQMVFIAPLYALPFIFVVGIYYNYASVPYVTPNKWVTGWKELARVVETEKRTFETEAGKPVFLLGMDKYYIASELAFYTNNVQDTYARNIIGKGALAYEFWDKADARGHNALAVHRKIPRLGLLKRYFTHVDENIKRIPIIRQGRIVRYFYLVKCYGYLKGNFPLSNKTILRPGAISKESS